MDKIKHSEIPWAKMINFGKKIIGKPYEFGAEINIDKIIKDPNPDYIKAIDCSELVEVLYALVGIYIPDGSYNQAKSTRRLEFKPGLDSDYLLIGDLGFKWNPENEVIHHVGIYFGGRDVLEAKGKKWGVIMTSYDEYIKSPHFAYWGRLKNIVE